MSKKTYAFRITCSLAGGVIETSEPQLSFSLPDVPTIEVHITASDAQHDQWYITSWCGGFNSEAEAHTAGLKVKTALILTGIFLGVGIDAGNDQIISPAFTRKDGTHDDRLQPEVHGLQVVPEIDEQLFGSLHFGRPYTPISPDTLQKKVAECFALGRPLSEKQMLSAQLYNHSHFHTTDAVRFLTLISSVEALVERKSRPPESLDLIEEMIQMVKKSVEPDTASLLGGLQNLRYESIGSTCRALVKEHCGRDKANAFARHYRIRSSLVHDGTPPTGIDLNLKVIELDNLVRILLVRNFSRASTTSAVN